MKPMLRFMVLGMTMACAGCASQPVIAPATVSVTPAANVSTTPSEEVVEREPTLAKLVHQLSEEAHTALVFTKDGKASAATSALARAGLKIQTSDADFDSPRSEGPCKNYDIVVVVVDGAPTDQTGKRASSLAHGGTPVIAMWRGEAGESLYGGVELVEGRGEQTTRFVAWMPESKTIRGDDLGARSPVLRGMQIDAEGSATVAGRLVRLATGDVAISVTGKGSRMAVVLLRGAGAAKLVARAKSAEEPASLAAVHGRMYFSAVDRRQSFWVIDVDDVRMDLDERAMRAVAARHAKLFDRAVNHVLHDQLVAAASDLEEGARILDDAFAGFGPVVSREVRFARAMAPRLREVAASGGGGKALIDRVAMLSEPQMMERDFVHAVARLAQTKLLRDYRTKSDEEAELAARVFFTASWLRAEGFQPVCREMSRRFPVPLRDGGDYHPPGFVID